MFGICNIVLAAMVLSLVMAAQDEGSVEFKQQCDTDTFEETSFNFAIDIDNFSKDCQDFEEMGNVIQLVIEEVQMIIPEYEEEFIDAAVCPLPALGREGVRKRVRRGTYSFAGAGGCKRCRQRARIYRGGRSLAVEKQHESFQNSNYKISLRRQSAFRELKKKDLDKKDERFDENDCETVVSSAVVDAAVAEKAVAESEVKLNEMLAMTMEKETKELLDEKQMEKFVKEAKKNFEECKKAGSLAKARALFIQKACESVDFAGVATPNDQLLGFEMVPKNFEKELQTNTKEAQAASYKVSDQRIELKAEIVKSKKREMDSTFNEEVKRLEAQLREESDKLKEVTKKTEGKIKTAKKIKDKNLEEELNMEIEMLNEKRRELEDDFNTFKEMEPKRIEDDYEFAMSALDAEAANTFEDYMEAFADLIAQALKGRLADKRFSNCFKKEPSVKVKLEKLKNKDDKITPESCPKEVE